MKSARLATSPKVAATQPLARATAALARPQKGQVIRGARTPAIGSDPAATGSGRLVVLDVGEALVVVGRPFERAALAGSPVDDLLDLAGELEILVGDPLGGMVHQP